MAYTLFSHYSTGIFPRPADDIDPKLKDESWFLGWCQYILGYGSRESNLTPYSRQDYIRNLRSYAEGSQDPDQYYRRFHDESKIDKPVSTTDFDNDSSYQGGKNRREAFMNVNWQILPVFPKYLQLLLGRFDSVEHEILADAIDPKSGAEREDLKWTTWFETNQREFLDNFYASIDSEPQIESEFVPDSIEELELFDTMGGFKLKHEIAIEELIRHNFQISGWNSTIKRKMIEDLVVIGFCSCKDYTDKVSGKVKTMYLDPERTIIPYKTEDEYDNPEFWGYMRLYRAAELRLHGVPEDKIKMYSKNVANHFGNNSWDEVERYQQKNPHLRAYDDFHIPVLECEWESVDTYFDQTRVNTKGQRIIKEEYFDVGIKRFNNNIYNSRKSNRKVDRTDIKVRYKCNWIIDSNDIFGYGKVYDTKRIDSDPQSSIHAYRLSGKSILERCVVNLDNMQINWLKLQNAIAIAAPPGIAVEYDSLTNISSGNGKDTFHPLDILRIRSQQGHILYKLTTMGTGTMLDGRGNAGKPIQELQGGFGNALNDALQAFQMDINMIQQNTGISSVADASNPDPRQPVKGSEFALAATNNALRMIYQGYISIKEKVAKVTSYKIQLLIQNDPKVYEQYFPVIGKAKLKNLDIAGEMSAAEYGIKIEAVPTEEMKSELKEQIKIALQSGKNGVPLLKSSQAMMLMNMIEGGSSLKLVGAFLSYYENKESQNQERIRQASITEQGEQKRQSDQQASELKLQEEQNKLNNSIQLEKVKGNEDRQTESLKHENKMAELLVIEKVRIGSQENLPDSV